MLQACWDFLVWLGFLLRSLIYYLVVKYLIKCINLWWSQVEFAEAEKAAEEAFRAERRRAIMEGREPPAPKKSKIEEIQEEEWEHLAQGLAAIGSQVRKAGDRPAAYERPPRLSSFS